MAAQTYSFGLTATKFVAWAARYRGEVGGASDPLTDVDFAELVGGVASDVCARLDDVLGEGTAEAINDLDDGDRAKARVRQVLSYLLLPHVHRSLYARSMEADEALRLNEDAQTKLNDLLMRPSAFGLDTGSGSAVTTALVPEQRDDTLFTTFRDTGRTRLLRW